MAISIVLSALFSTVFTIFLRSPTVLIFFFCASIIILFTFPLLSEQTDWATTRFEKSWKKASTPKNSKIFRKV